MTGYALASYVGPTGSAVAGVVIGSLLYDAGQLLEGTGVDASGGVAGLLADWPQTDPALAAASGSPAAEPVSEVGAAELLAPLSPGAIFCAGANYADHASEMSGRTLAAKSGSRPYFFSKLPRCVVGPGAVVTYPDRSTQLDWEAELAVVIGRPARRVAVEQALEHVAGYTIFNDLSARDLARTPGSERFGVDWVASKCFDGAAPMGPWLVPARSIPDPQRLSIRLWVDEVCRQDASTADMHWTVAEQVSMLSEDVTLLPGDVISTGTPAGAGRPKGVFLQSGQQVRVEIERIGVLTHRVGPHLPVSPGRRRDHQWLASA